MTSSTITALAGIIADFGGPVEHFNTASADTETPWKPKDDGTGDPSQAGQQLAGMLQTLAPDSGTNLPEGGIRARCVLVVRNTQQTPKPLDTLSLAGQRWRIHSILPVSRGKGMVISEAVVSAIGSGSSQQ